MKQKPTYKKPVAACAIILFVGAITLAVLMETRQMAPPRKYEVDMSGEVIGIDHGPKTPVLTKEEVKDEEEVGIYRGKEAERGGSILRNG